MSVVAVSVATALAAGDGGRFRLGFVGRNYPHKNTRIFPALIEVLRREYGIRASVHVTFTDEEWAACDETFRAAVSNAGVLSVVQCLSFYRSMDAVIFLCLLECFSATALEAMVMERPLFASDRPFISGCVCRACPFFAPADPADAAASIAAYLRDNNQGEARLAVARQHALAFSSASDRARQYLACLVAAADKNSSLLIRS